MFRSKPKSSVLMSIEFSRLCATTSGTKVMRRPRGSRGALMARAGNAYDKSLLLGALLGQHGLEVRYVRGRLTADRAAALVRQMYVPSNYVPARLDRGIGLPAKTEAAHRELGRLGAARCRRAWTRSTRR